MLGRPNCRPGMGIERGSIREGSLTRKRLQREGEKKRGSRAERWEEEGETGPQGRQSQLLTGSPGP